MSLGSHAMAEKSCLVRTGSESSLFTDSYNIQRTRDTLGTRDLQEWSEILYSTDLGVL